MIIKALVENTSTSKELKSIHGLSLYIETQKHKILFDLGPGKLFLENAQKMNINIEDIDIVIISHGHNDHGGALKAFLKNNQKAKIYIKDTAFEDYYMRLLCFKIYVGLDQGLHNNNRIILTKDYLKIDEELELFSNVTEQKLLPSANNKLYKKSGKRYIMDTFDHEQSLILRQNNTYTLIAGCAHNGIVNILNKAEDIIGMEINKVISGFHLFQLSLDKAENMDYLHELAKALKSRRSIYYTCHCTGKKQYDVLHKDMGDQMNYISTGMTIEFV
ncbi:MAG: fold hydrolase [Herbinix sp.]|jgi:7,8-dihydropterin-6-yl-methyl-4-(beta-D-ribofuranosyl)aminobenzene 5'-phosphate synthase|nr:fold hydrolase [Herbinix sp.]